MPPGPPGPYQDAKRKANENVVMIMASGRLTGYTQYAEDISNVLDGLPGNDLRVIPVIGKSAGQNVLDMLYMKGVDMGVVDQDILSYLKRTDPRLYGDIDQRIQYVTKLFNTELHVYAKNEIRSLEDLRGKKVSCLKPMSTVALLCENLFLALGIKVEIVFDDAALAMQKVKSGEVAAAARGAQPPLQGFENVKPEDDLHFVPIDKASLPNSNFNALRAAYLPARLKSQHYPAMIPAGQEVPTIATSTLLAVYNWPPGSERFQRIANFVNIFFDNIDKFAKPPRHPGWADVNLAAEVPGWTRYSTAQEWLNKKRQAAPATTGSISSGDQIKAEFLAFVDEFSKSRGTNAPLTEAEKNAMWTQFQQWSVQQSRR
ncbi:MULTISPECIES: TAXI family TRAP transporter solute-binding subunit [Rhodomicrobium]|uniref:TAXI family TRAP transporter solute-binding subunit n=1 Tax=Rhodomicrobium TaxID=1068 RepID=UPI00148286D2|nr:MULTISPECIES: TAXI family TRAP transporter solute-binding subunit [Rhodomicrobium]